MLNKELVNEARKALEALSFDALITFQAAERAHFENDDAASSCALKAARDDYDAAMKARRLVDSILDH